MPERCMTIHLRLCRVNYIDPIPTSYSTPLASLAKRLTPVYSELESSEYSRADHGKWAYTAALKNVESIAMGYMAFHQGYLPWMFLVGLLFIVLPDRKNPLSGVMLGAEESSFPYLRLALLRPSLDGEGTAVKPRSPQDQLHLVFRSRYLVLG